MTYFLSLLAYFMVAVPSHPAPISIGDPPVIQWITETDHDFGQVRQGYPVKFTFQFKNITQEPILLETVRTTCGCTAAKWPEEPILPGETGDILIEFDTFKSGDFRKKIRVFFNKQRKAEILWIGGSVD